MKWIHDLAGLMNQDAHGVRFFDKKKQKWSYRVIKTPPTTKVIDRHLSKTDPDHSAAAYVLSDEDNKTGRVIVFDFDDHDGTSDEIETIVASFCLYLDERDMPHLLVRSGGGHGYHVWLIFETQKSIKSLRDLATKILKEVEVCTGKQIEETGKMDRVKLSEGARGVAQRQVEIIPKTGGHNLIAIPCARSSIRLKRDELKLIECGADHLPLIKTEKSPPKPLPKDPGKDAAFEALVSKRDPSDYDDWYKVAMRMIAAFGIGDEWAFEKWAAWAKTGFKSDNIDGQRGKWRDCASTRMSAKTFWLDARSRGYNGPLPFSKLDQFNEKFCVIRDGRNVLMGLESYEPTFERTRWDLLSQTAFLLFNENSRDAKAWMEWPGRRFYPNGFIFDPTGKQHDGFLNLWKDWAVEPKEGPWPLLRRHIHEVLADGDTDYADYIINWIAWMVQNPHLPAEVALVFRGGKGTGKGTLGRALQRMCGQHGIQVSSSKLFTGNFNAHLRDCIFLFADEAFWAGDKQGEGQLKRMVTEDTLMVEAKHRDAVSVRNLLHIMVASNEDWVVPATGDERRYAIFDVSDKRVGDRDYFDALNGEDSLPGMMYEMLARDLGGFHPRYDVPRTEALHDQIQQSEPAERALLRSILREGHLPGTDSRYPLPPQWMVFAHLREALSRYPFGARVTDAKVGRLLNTIPGVTRNNNGWMVTGTDKEGRPITKRCLQYIMPPLAQVRKWFDPDENWGEPLQWEYEKQAVAEDEVPI